VNALANDGRVELPPQSGQQSSVWGWKWLSSSVATRCVRCSQFRQGLVSRSFINREDTHLRPPNQDQPDAYRTQEFRKLLGGD
jgi:hypothetical protein